MPALQRWHTFFHLAIKQKGLKKFLPVILLLACSAVKAQKIDSIYVNLYTDSLKKGTYNYINVDGLLSNGSYLPLDSTYILLTASSGKFYGNSLFIEKDFAQEKVIIKVTLKKNMALYKEFTMYIKIKPDSENLKTVDELLNSSPPKPKRKKG
jgi:hypothetical protein